MENINDILRQLLPDIVALHDLEREIEEIHRAYDELDSEIEQHGNKTDRDENDTTFFEIIEKIGKLERELFDKYNTRVALLAKLKQQPMPAWLKI